MNTTTNARPGSVYELRGGGGTKKPAAVINYHDADGVSRKFTLTADTEAAVRAKQAEAIQLLNTGMPVAEVKAQLRSRQEGVQAGAISTKETRTGQSYRVVITYPHPPGMPGPRARLSLTAATEAEVAAKRDDAIRLFDEGVPVDEIKARLACRPAGANTARPLPVYTQPRADGTTAHLAPIAYYDADGVHDRLTLTADTEDAARAKQAQAVQLYNDGTPIAEIKARLGRVSRGVYDIRSGHTMKAAAVVYYRRPDGTPHKFTVTADTEAEVKAKQAEAVRLLGTGMTAPEVKAELRRQAGAQAGPIAVKKHRAGLAYRVVVTFPSVHGPRRKLDLCASTEADAAAKRDEAIRLYNDGVPVDEIKARVGRQVGAAAAGTARPGVVRAVKRVKGIAYEAVINYHDADGVSRKFTLTAPTEDAARAKQTEAVQLYNDGTPIAEIKARLGRLIGHSTMYATPRYKGKLTYQAVTRWRDSDGKAHQLTFNAFTEAEAQEKADAAGELVKAGVPRAEILARIGGRRLAAGVRTVRGGYAAPLTSGHTLSPIYGHTADEAQANRLKARELARLGVPLLEAVERAQLADGQPTAVQRVEADGINIDPLGCYVYIAWGCWGDGDDRVLYVGQTTTPLTRFGNHQALTAERLPLIERVQMLWCADEIEMNRVEWLLIQHYQPPWNVQGVRAAA